MFTKSSDVWSFGVLFWEVFNKGKLPFKNIKDDRALLTEVSLLFVLLMEISANHLSCRATMSRTSICSPS